MKGILPVVLGLIPLGLGVAGLVALTTLPTSSVRLAGYATRLQGRTRAQRHNAELAARSLNGAIIPPHGTFSFNKTVRTWSVDRGYVRAPVSYDGELVPAFGGGVCQTSTTLYNTALLAGMTIAERHHHVFAPHYVPPGRDAAVAYPNIDLRFTNPHPFPVRIQAGITGDMLMVDIWGQKKPVAVYSLVSRILSVKPAERQMRQVSAKAGLPSVARYAGTSGFRVVTYRVIAKPGQEAQRERLSDDSYPSMPDIISVAEAAP